MKYEKVIDKVLKLQVLAERGAEGESKAAQRALNALCTQYNIKLEDLFNEEVKRREFKIPYHDSFAQAILFQIYAKVTDNRTITYSSNQYKNKIYFDLTNSQYVEIERMFDFFFTQWKKEKKQLLKDLIDTFINKHDLFSSDAREDNTPMTPERWEKILRMISLMGQLENVSYYKQLEK